MPFCVNFLLFLGVVSNQGKYIGFLWTAACMAIKMINATLQTCLIPQLPCYYFLVNFVFSSIVIIAKGSGNVTQLPLTVLYKTLGKSARLWASSQSGG